MWMTLNITEHNIKNVLNINHVFKYHQMSHLEGIIYALLYRFTCQQFVMTLVQQSSSRQRKFMHILFSCTHEENEVALVMKLDFSLQSSEC